MSILDRIDATLENLCPCGAPPRAGSAYCSEDCVPNWRGEHTVSDVDGTAMRWRPDLVTAVDDSDLTLIAEFPVRSNWGRIYGRAGSDNIHLRLDDGYRFVGTDVAPDQAGSPDVEPGLRRELDPVWQRLERELGNAAHVETDPWADVARSWLAPLYSRRPSEGDRQRICDWLRANGLDPNDIPDDSPIRVRRDSITVEVVRRDEAGRVRVNGYHAIAEPQTVPLVERWPADLRYNRLVADDLALVSLPEGELLDGLVSAEAEARLRQRARELAQSDTLTRTTMQAEFRQSATYRWLLTSPVIDPSRFLVASVF